MGVSIKLCHAGLQSSGYEVDLQTSEMIAFEKHYELDIQNQKFK